MAKSKFVLLPVGTIDKALIIRKADELDIAVDYDDVQHKQVLKDAKKIVRLLNKHWYDKKAPTP